MKAQTAMDLGKQLRQEIEDTYVINEILLSDLKKFIVLTDQKSKEHEKSNEG